jgi:putative membrane protein insertion efficiency factor
MIRVYQQIISPLLRQLTGTTYACRYDLSCSEFSKRALQKYGIIKGLKLTGLRIMSCQPWFKLNNYGANI